MTTFGDRLRALRKDAGLTQIDAAKIVRVTQSFYARMECGKNGATLKRLAMLADMLNLRGRERRLFIFDGYLASLPDEERGLVRSMIAEVRR